MPRVSDAQVRKLMEMMTKHGQVGLAALEAGMDRKTARKYLRAEKLPSQMKTPRHWRTRENPFAGIWDAVVALLTDAPELQAKAIFDYLSSRSADDPQQPTLQEGQLRTFQRHVRQWRAQAGPPKEVFFAQAHVPGEAMQLDFTNANELGITIAGVAFTHLLCHCCLPYSNWQWATTCGSESMLALKHGLQSALFTRGRVPQRVQNAHSTAAPHRLADGVPSARGFNHKYADMVAHFSIKPRTTAVGAKEQNGDIEALNGALKRRLKQNLLLRGSTDFASVEAYESWMGRILDRANTLRSVKISKELAAMRPLNVARLPEYEELDVRVSKWSMIRVSENGYSVPSRLIGETLKVRAYEDKLEVYFAGQLELCVERLRGRGHVRINYRHLIHSLYRKPGAFTRYKYREELFPSLVFRRAYDALEAKHAGYKANLEYVSLLYLAATHFESDVEIAIELMLNEGQVPLHADVSELVRDEPTEVPQLELPEVDLRPYDRLIAQFGALI